MDEITFRDVLEQEGYEKISVTEWKADTRSKSHAHEFDVYGLLLSGTFTVTTDASVIACRPGETFKVGAETSHTETVGPEGARVLIGRRA